MPTREEAYKKIKASGQFSEEEINAHLDQEFPKATREEAYKKIKASGQFSEEEINAHLDQEFPSQKKKETPSKNSGVGSGERELFDNSDNKYEEKDTSALENPYKDLLSGPSIGDKRKETASELAGRITTGHDKSVESEVETLKNTTESPISNIAQNYDDKYDFNKEKEAEVVDMRAPQHKAEKEMSEAESSKMASDLSSDRKKYISEIKILQDQVMSLPDDNLNKIRKKKIAENIEKIKGVSKNLNNIRADKPSLGMSEEEELNQLAEKRVKDRNRLQTQKAAEVYGLDFKRTKENELILQESASELSEEAEDWVANLDIETLSNDIGKSKADHLEDLLYKKNIPDLKAQLAKYDPSVISRVFSKIMGSTEGGNITDLQKAFGILDEEGNKVTIDEEEAKHLSSGEVIDKGSVEEERVAKQLAKTLMLYNMVENKVDPTKVFGEGRMIPLVGGASKGVSRAGVDILNAFDLGVEGAKTSGSFIRDDLKSHSKAREILTEIGVDAGVNLDEFTDKYEKDLIDVDRADELIEMLGYYATASQVGSGTLQAVSKSALALKGADKFRKYVNALDKTIKTGSPGAALKAKIIKQTMNSAYEGVSMEISGRAVRDKELNMASGALGSAMKALTKSGVLKMLPKDNSYGKMIVKAVAGSSGETIGEFTEEIVQNGIRPLLDMNGKELAAFVLTTSIMGVGTGAGQLDTEFTKMTTEAYNKLSPDQKLAFDKVTGESEVAKNIEDSFSVGQTVEFDTKTGETTEASDTKLAVDVDGNPILDEKGNQLTEKEADLKQGYIAEQEGETDLTNDTDTKTTEAPITGETEATTETEQIGGVESDAKKDISEEPSVTTTKKEGIKPSESKTAEEESKRIASETKAINDSREAELKSIEGKGSNEKGQQALERDVNERHDAKLEELKDSEKVFNKRGNEVKLTKKEKAQDKEIEKKNKENQPVVDLFNKLKTWNELSTYQQGREVNNNKRKELNDLAQKNGYDLKSVSGTYKLFKEGNVDKDGKPKPSGKPRLQETNKDKAKSKMLLSEESPEFQKDFKKLKETNQLDFYTTGEADANRLDISDFDNDKQFQAGMRDIENGVRSFNAQTILDFVERYRREGNLPMVTGKGDLQALHTVTKEQIDLEAQGVFKKKNMAPTVVQEFISSKRNVDAILDPENEIEGFNELSVEDQDLIYDTAIQLKNNDRAVLDSNGDVYVFDKKDSSKGEVIETGKLRESDTAKNLKESSIIPQETKNNLTEEKTHFEVFSDAKAKKEAIDFVNSKTSLDDAIDSVVKKSSDFESLPDKTQMAVRASLIVAITDNLKVLENTVDGDMARAETLTDYLDTLAEDLVTEGHKRGLGLQAMAMFNKMVYGDPFTDKVRAKKDVNKNADKMLRRSKGKKKLAEKVAKEGNKKALKDKSFEKDRKSVAEEIAEKKLKKEAEEEAKKKAENDLSSPKSRKKAQKELDDAIADLGELVGKAVESFGAKKSLHGEETITVAEIIKELKPILVKIAEGLIKRGVYNYKDWKANYDKKIDDKFKEQFKKAKTPEQKELIRKIHTEAKSKSEEIWEGSQDKVIETEKAFAKSRPKDALRKKARQMDVLLDKLFTEHFTNVEAAKKKLVDKIITDIKVTKEEAIEIEKKLMDSFKEIATEKKRQILTRKLSPKKGKTPTPKESFYEQIIKISNAGAMSDADLVTELKDYLKIEALTPKIMKEIERLSNRVAEAKGENEKNHRIYELTDYTKKQQGFDKSDIRIAIYLGNLFGGISTNIFNVSSNFFGGMMDPIDLFTSSIFEGKGLGQSTKAGLSAIPKWWSAFSKGIGEAKNIVRTGDVVHRGMAPDSRTLEIIAKMSDQEMADKNVTSGFANTKFSRKWTKASAWWGSKVFRTLSAGDAAFFTGAYDTKLATDIRHEIWALEKKNPKSTDAENLRTVLEQMYSSSDFFTEATNESGEAFNDIKDLHDEKFPNKKFNPKKYKSRIERRAWELVTEENQRIESELEDAQLKDRLDVAKEKAKLYAAYTTLTNTPIGILGAVGSLINKGLDMTPQAKYAKLIIPVVNTVINYVNRNLDHSPYGLGMVVLARLDKLPEGKTKELYKELAPTILAKATRGTLALATMSAMFMRFEEEDKDGRKKSTNLMSKITGMDCDIIGSGPSTWKEAKQFIKDGGRLNSIKIGNLFIPIEMSSISYIYRFIGSFQDQERFGKAKPGKNMATRFFNAHLDIPKFAIEGGPVEAVSTLPDMMFKRDEIDDVGHDLLKGIGSKASMFLMPGGNFTKQLVKAVNRGEQIDRSNVEGAMAYMIPWSEHLIDGAFVQLAWDGKPIQNYPGAKQWASWSNDPISDLKREKRITFKTLDRRTATIFSSSKLEDILMEDHPEMFFDLNRKFGEALRKKFTEKRKYFKDLDPKKDKDLKRIDSKVKQIEKSALKEAKRYVKDSRKYRRLFN